VTAKEPSGGPEVVLRLYVAGNSPNSLQARANLETLCRLRDETFRIEIVDALEEPLRLLKDRIPATPALVKVSPSPTVRILGTLVDHDEVLTLLGLLKNA